jgi:hypothetical protein
VTAWTAEALPPELVAILDEQAGRVHSPNGAVRRCLADILNAYDELREEAEHPAAPDTDKLCCCDTGADCPACMTGRCHECPDNPERERDDEDEGDDD